MGFSGLIHLFRVTVGLIFLLAFGGLSTFGGLSEFSGLSAFDGVIAFLVVF